MSEDHSLQIISQRPGLPPVAEVSHLVRGALSFFESDRAAAWRCLRDAYHLLGAGAGELHLELPAARLAPRRGGLPKWRAKRALDYIEANLGSKIVIGEWQMLLN